MKKLGRLISIILFSCLPTLLLVVVAQQPYIRGTNEDCRVATDADNNSTSFLGYSCNPLRPTCQSYLTFRPQPPFDSVPTISALLSVNSSQLAQLNSVPAGATFRSLVLIPVPCSCTSNQLSQFNTSYTIRPNDTYSNIARITFQGLSTCQALQAQNPFPPNNLSIGAQITVPLRCACPSPNQFDNFLLTYVVAPNQDLSTIAAQFSVNVSQIRAANRLSQTETNIFPSSTLLIPLRDPPTSTQATAPQPPPPPPPEAAATPPSSRGGSSRTWIYVVAGVVGGFFLLATLIFCLFFYNNKNQKKKKKLGPVESSQTQSFESVEKPLTNESNDDSRDFLESISSIAQSLKVYTFAEIKSATDGFSPGCLIKGSVYRGTINGDFAAVKTMNGDVSKEISLLNKINHFNLVRLSGVAFNDGNWYLVYEYASNGSLYDFLILDKKTVNWNQRLQIAVDVAAGLNYLHFYTSPPYVHKDLTSANVLLDRDFRAKIANFGLARSAEGQDGQFALTRHVVGTKGYMAPEYLENGVVSPKIDVYAFGVLLLEILSGKQVSTFGTDIWQFSDILSGDESLTNVMDPALEGKYPQELARVVLGLIDGCVKKDPSDRPSMDNVFQKLSRISTSAVSGEWAISVSESQTRPR